MFLASASNTSMKSRPMVLRFASGSVTPASSRRNSASASTCTSGMLYESRKSVTTRSASPARKKPWSTKTQVSWSATASWISTAATADAGAKEAVVEEAAGGGAGAALVEQPRRDRRVDAAGKAADHPALPHLRADAGDRLLAEGPHGPVAGRADDPAHEVAQKRR